VRTLSILTTLHIPRPTCNAKRCFREEDPRVGVCVPVSPDRGNNVAPDLEASISIGSGQLFSHTPQRMKWVRTFLFEIVLDAVPRHWLVWLVIEPRPHHICISTQRRMTRVVAVFLACMHVIADSDVVELQRGFHHHLEKTCLCATAGSLFRLPYINRCAPFAYRLPDVALVIKHEYIIMRASLSSLWGLPGNLSRWPRCQGGGNARVIQISRLFVDFVAIIR
jgi:hypothetical protein